MQNEELLKDPKYPIQVNYPYLCGECPYTSVQKYFYSSEKLHWPVLLFVYAVKSFIDRYFYLCMLLKASLTGTSICVCCLKVYTHFKPPATSILGISIFMILSKFHF